MSENQPPKPIDYGKRAGLDCEQCWNPVDLCICNPKCEKNEAETGATESASIVPNPPNEEIENMSDYTIKNLKLPTRINKACDEGSMRFALGTVRVVPQSETKATLCATDGRILALVDTTADHIDSAVRATSIPNKIIPKRANTKRTDYRTVSLNGQWESGDGKYLPADDENGRFPRVGSVLPDIDDTLRVVLDIDLLHNLADALTTVGEDKLVTLCIRTGDGAVAVIGASGVGVVMPCRHDKKTEAIETDRYNRIRDIACKADWNG